MVLKVFLTESNAKIEGKILRAIAEDVNKSFSAKTGLINNIFSRHVYDAVLNCPEMNSVSSGKLKIDFGLNFDPVAAIADAVSQSVTVSFKSFNTKLTTGGFNISVQPLDYLNVLSLPQSIVVTDKGATLPWADWLISYGDSVIVANFGVKYKGGEGRSGGGFMTPQYRPFRVDASFSGTVDNNFITRAIMGEIPAIEQSLIGALK